MRRLVPLLAFLAVTPPSAAQQQAPPRHPPSYQGTVQSIRHAAGEVDLLIGVGEALRVLRLRIVPATRVTGGGGSATAADILPGDVIRADCHPTPQGLVADRIEKLERGRP